MASGKVVGLPGLDRRLKALRVGDILVVWRLARPGRSLPDLVRMVAELEGKGIGFESITDMIETASAAENGCCVSSPRWPSSSQPNSGSHSVRLSCRACSRGGAQAKAGCMTN